MRILVVDDEQLLAETLAQVLVRDAHAVDVCFDGAEALDRLSYTAYDVVILDRDLPAVHGDEVCRSLSSVMGERPRILMLTGSGSVEDRVTGLEIGADDYLVKPFAMRELRARVTALSRRDVGGSPLVFRRAGVSVDPSRRMVTREGRLVPLSRQEFAVLVELMRADGGFVSAERLLEKAWDDQVNPFSHTVRVTIQKLRRKLGDPDVIVTERGMGYRIR